MDDFVYRLESCLDGTVNDLAGPITDTLFINGQSRNAQVAEGELTWGAMLAPPAGGSGKFAIHANAGNPSSATHVELPAAIGTICFPLFLTQAAQPVAIWNNLGREAKLGASQYFDGSPIDDPAIAPTVFLQLFSGDVTNLPMGTVLTLQGVQIDPGSSSPLGASTTNAVMLEIL